MAKKYGICHLCGKNAELTFEHVPPRAANNKTAARIITGRELFNTQKLKSGKSLRYESRQQGAGNYTLCRKCNNNTGNWYANEYVKFANEIGYLLTNEIDPNTAKGIWMQTNELYLQRIIKQILCMFISTIKPEDALQLKDISEYVLDKENWRFDNKKYRISMYLMKNYEVASSGIMQFVLKQNGKLRTKKFAIMNLYPIGLILEINPDGNVLPETTDITKFTTLKYNELQDVKMTFSITDRYSLREFSKQIIIGNIEMMGESK